MMENILVGLAVCIAAGFVVRKLWSSLKKPTCGGSCENCPYAQSGKCPSLLQIDEKNRSK